MVFKLLQRSTTGGHLVRKVRRWLRGSEAVTATEYAILTALIILVSVASIRLIGEKFFNLYTMIANAVGDTV